MTDVTRILVNPRNFAQERVNIRETQDLKTIGIECLQDEGWLAAEFWDRYDTVEF